MNLDNQRNFTGNATALCEAALVCAQSLGLELDEDKTGERLVRYYVAEGVIDRPERVGRDAAYGWRHLLQFLTARRMAQAGTALSVVAQHNAAATTKALEEGLSRPLPTAAELLVSGFLGVAGKAGRTGKASAPPASFALRSGKAPSHTPARPQLAWPDVLDEMRQMTATLMSRMDQLEKRQESYAASSLMPPAMHVAEVRHYSRASTEELEMEVHRLESLARRLHELTQHMHESTERQIEMVARLEARIHELEKFSLALKKRPD
jgi:hypothetical protein